MQEWALMTVFCDAGLDGFTPSPESLLADFAGNIRLSSGFGEASACLFASSGDTARAGLRSGLLSVRWPGTPWIGGYAGVARPGLYAPALYDPLVEHDWLGPDSMFSFGLTSGGFLGSRLDASALVLPGDTLSVFSVRSPWLGFGALDYWSCTGIDSPGTPSSIRCLSGEIRLRSVTPWFALVSTGHGADSGAVLAEIRGIRIASSSSGGVFFTPGITLAGDSASVPGGAFETGRSILGAALALIPSGRAVCWSLKGCYDPGAPSRSSGSAAFSMLSRAGLEYRAGLDRVGQGRPLSALGLRYHRRGATCGVALAADGDSLRVTGLAGYSPAAGVTALLSVSADTDDSPEPSLALATAAAFRGVHGVLRLTREGGETVLSLTARVLLP